MGTPYAVSSDLVSAYPAKSLAIAQYIDGYKLDTGPVQNAQTGTSFTFALTDTTKIVTANNAAASAYTVPPQSSVVWEAYTVLRLVNLGAGVVTLTAGAGVTLTGTLTVPQYGSVTIMRTASNAWTISGSAATAASATANVATTQTTTSATFVDLATVGPSVTVVTGTKALVFIACMNTTSVADYVVAGVAVSGATTLAASDLYAIGGYTAGVNVPQTQAANAFMLTGLTAGSNTFTMKYRRVSGTATFSQRIITVVDMGS